MRVMRATAMTFVLAVLLPTQAMGQSLVDPTRPPAHAAGVEASGGGDSEVEPRILERWLAQTQDAQKIA